MPWDPPSRKGKVRKRMDERLLAAHRSGAIRMVIGRASDFHGPEALNSTTLGEYFFTAYLAGKPVNWVGKLDRPHTFSYVKDFGRGLVTLGAHEEALGQAWHIPAAETLTSRQFLDLVFEAGGRRVKIRPASGRVLGVLGLFNPVLREVAEMAYEFEDPFMMDSSKFARAFGADPTPHREAIRATVEWFRARQANHAHRIGKN
jgi:nucleoside-diphosphate-sugar epimerase